MAFGRAAVSNVAPDSWNAPNHTITFGATGLPSGLGISSSTGVISGTILYGAASSTPYSVTITANDSAGGASDAIAILWYVYARQIGIMNPGGLSSAVGASVQLPTQASSTDGASLTYNASVLPDGLSINSNTGLISGTIASTAEASSPYTVTVTATNTGAQMSASATFNWTVSRLALQNPGNQAGFIGDSLALNLNAYQSQSGTLTFSAQFLPPGLAIGSGTGTISGTITSAAHTDTPYSVHVGVTDGTLSASQTFQWSVSVPVVTLYRPSDQVSVDGDVANLPSFAWNSAYHLWSFAATGLPLGLTINATTGLISGTVSSSAHTSSPYSVTVTATDTNANVSASQTFAWSVSQASVSDPGSWQNLVGDTVNYQFFASGNFHNTVSFNASILPAGVSIDSYSGVLSGTIANSADAGSPYLVTVTATDGTVTASRTFSWTVSQILLQDIGDQYNIDGEAVNLPIHFFGVDGLTCSARGLPPGLSIDPTIGTIFGTLPANADTNGPYLVTVVATLGNNVSVSKTFTWTVLAGDAFANLPDNINNFRARLIATFSRDVQDALNTANESGSWRAHHTYEVGSHGNDQILANRLYNSDLRVGGQRINVHAPGNVVFVPQQVHLDIGRANAQFWADQMRQHGWRNLQEAYRNVNLQTYKTFQDNLWGQYRQYVLTNGATMADLNRVRSALGLPAYNPAPRATNQGVGSQQAQARWRRDRSAALARWGRAVGITLGALSILSTLASNAATANQILNPSEATQAALDRVLNDYERVLTRRLRGDNIINTAQDYQNLVFDLDAYLAAIEAPNLVRAQVSRMMLGLLQ